MFRVGTASGHPQRRAHGRGDSLAGRRSRHRRGAIGLAIVSPVFVATLVLGIAADTGLLPILPTLPGRHGGAGVLITSQPAGADVRIDGRTRGQTPLTVALAPGRHEIVVGGGPFAPQAAELIVPAAASGAAAAPPPIDFALWSATPAVIPLYPPVPGATIDDALFTDGGQLILTIVLPGSDERQLWLTDGAGAARRLGPPALRGPAAPSPDGQRVAWLAATPRQGPANLSRPARLGEVWLGSSGLGGRGGPEPSRIWSLSPDRATDPPGEAERLADLAWTPDGRALLVTARREVGGHLHSRLLRLPVGDGGEIAAAVELLAVVGEPVPHSWSWRADGSQGALLIATGDRLGLVALGLDPTAPYARHLDDLPAGRGAARRSPVAWHPDGRTLAYLTAPRDPKVPVVLGLAPVDGGAIRRLETGNGLFPDWRAGGGAQGTLLMLHPGREGLALRATDPASGLTTNGPTLPLPRGAVPVGVTWERDGRRAIVALELPDRATAPLAHYLIDWR